jgi:hypothetical protein
MMADAWLSDFTTFVAPTGVNVLPGQDTFRGGALLVVASSDVLDTTRDALLTSLPAGWSTSGLVDFPALRRGALLRGTASAPALLTTADADYVNFDAAVDIEPLSPPDGPPSDALIGCLEHPAGGGTARVCLVRGAFSDPSQLLAIGEAFAGDPAAGVAAVPAGIQTLRLVRNQDRVYGFVGTRGAGADSYVTLTKILDAPAPALGTSTGPLRLASRAESSQRTTSAVFRNFTVRSHASINGRLLDEKTVPTNRQVVGLVPRATIEEVGFATVSVFGLFGTVSSTDTFQYILPAPRTVGNEIVRTLRTYQDPVVRDRS